MALRVASMLHAAVIGLLPLTSTAQQQGPPPPPPPPPATAEGAQSKPPTKPAPATKPIDPTRAAAELLRRRLGLKPGPIGQPPQGPPKPPGADPKEAEAGAASGTAAQDPKPKPPSAETQGAQEGKTQQGKTQEPKAQEPKPNVVQDPTKAAAEALKKLLPGAKPPEVAPIPDATGTPEPFLAQPEPSAIEPTPTSKTPDPIALPWRGMLSSRYRARHGEGVTDQDLTARLSLDVGLEDSDPFTFHIAGRGFLDLDGRRSNSPFGSLDNSFGSDGNARLYRAHLDAHELPYLELARAGRQDLDETPTPLTFDGLRVDTEAIGAGKVSASAYGGVPVHHFEASPSGDSVFGAAIAMQPWHAARLRFDWMSLRDDFLALERHDELLSARWWQSFDSHQLRGVHTWVDGKPRDLHLSAAGELPLVLGYSVDYRELLTTQRAEVTELDPFFAIAAEYRPYRQLDASLSSDLGEHLTATTGAAVRRLRDRSDEGSFNREFERVYLDGTLRNFGIAHLSVSAAASMWNSQGEDFRTLTGELEYRPDRELRVRLGTGYDLFKYDVFLDRERVHVRSIYFRTDYRLSDAVRLDGAYEYEREDGSEFHLFRLGMTWTF